MIDYVDLEIAISRYGEAYQVQVRWEKPLDATTRIGLKGAADFDLTALRALRGSPPSYGTLLQQSLFKDPRVSDEFVKARQAAEDLNADLRTRLLIDESATELHGVCWESLRVPPEGKDFLFVDKRILFSRYIPTRQEGSSRRKRGFLRALAVIASPEKGQDGSPPPLPIPVEAEKTKAEAVLGKDVEITFLVTDPAHNVHVTLEDLIVLLDAERPFDILYLVCHGTLTRGAKREPVIILERKDGTEHRAPGSALIDRIRNLGTSKPLLVVLASCESAGDGIEPSRGEDGALAGLGPQLADAGVAAVIAFQGSIPTPTALPMMERFFVALTKFGEVDRAMTEARFYCRDQQFWDAVLFSRLRNGTIWYEPKFIDEDPTRWDEIRASVESQSCLPILGAGLTERLFGSSCYLAQTWADEARFPLAPRYEQELPQIAQYLLVSQGMNRLRRQITAHWIRQLQRYEPAEALTKIQLQQLVLNAGRRRREQDSTEPHRLLADLPFPVYLTANQDTWLEDALREAGKAPTVEFFRWNHDLQDLKRFPRRYNEGSESETTPLVYHLFGSIDIIDSLVLTEDDYFEYLTSMARSAGDFPSAVEQALTTNVLLFLGFSVTDWHFRLLLRSLLPGERRRTRAYPVTRALAVQVSPGEDVREPARAAEYFRKYFQDAAVRDMYFGHAEDFVEDLWRHCKEAP